LSAEEAGISKCIVCKPVDHLDLFRLLHQKNMPVYGVGNLKKEVSL
jgi:hypothetical protein